MREKHRFLVSYIIDNQPTTMEVQCAAEHLSPEQARAHVEARHDNRPSEHITDIQVTPVLHPDSEPGHNYQP